MSIWQAILLGVIQALTEFLPVSSSGHLVVGSALMGIEHSEDVLFEVCVHLGTLGAVFWVYRRSLWSMMSGAVTALRRGRESANHAQREGLYLMLWVGLGSVPTAILGLLFKDDFEALFGAPRWVAVLFLVTAVLLILTRWAPRGRVGAIGLGPWRALAIGLIQWLAIAPGISRAGSTIALALFLGVERTEASRYSFLLSIPAILGAALLQAAEVESLTSGRLTVCLIGAAVSCLAGLAALYLLLRVVRKGQLAWFAAYLVPLAVAVLVWA